VTDPATDFHKSSCGDLANGVHVSGKGHGQTSGVVLAERIDVKKPG
jgi:hypothetical protein